jgi:hypothetical protein
VVRSKLNRPLTLSEKILYSHLDDPETQVGAGREIEMYGLNAMPQKREAGEGKRRRRGGWRTTIIHLP